MKVVRHHIRSNSFPSFAVVDLEASLPPGPHRMDALEGRWVKLWSEVHQDYNYALDFRDPLVAAIFYVDWMQRGSTV